MVGTEGELLECDICGAMHVEPDLLVRHCVHDHVQQSGAGSKHRASRRPQATLRCLICRATMASPLDLALHLRQHDRAGVFTYQCSACRLPFASIPHRIQHEAAHVQEAAAYRCATCPALAPSSASSTIKKNREEKERKRRTYGSG